MGFTVNDYEKFKADLGAEEYGPEYYAGAFYKAFDADRTFVHEEMTNEEYATELLKFRAWWDAKANLDDFNDWRASLINTAPDTTPDDDYRFFSDEALSYWVEEQIVFEGLDEAEKTLSVKNDARKWTCNARI